MAEEFAARGAQIVACDIVAERTEATRDLAQRAGAREAIAVTADVSVADGAAKAVAAAEERLGTRGHPLLETRASSTTTAPRSTPARSSGIRSST